jgi:hypothetical protein
MRKAPATDWYDPRPFRNQLVTTLVKSLLVISLVAAVWAVLWFDTALDSMF